VGLDLAPEGRFVCSKEGKLPPPSIEPWKGDLFVADKVQGKGKGRGRKV
jgi:hypothetical protein